jgi:RNA polymerase sigma-70 factor (ECF subfamily)
MGLPRTVVRPGAHPVPSVHPNQGRSSQRVHDVVVDAVFVSRRPGPTRHSFGEVASMTTDEEFEHFFLAQYDVVLKLLVLTTGDRERATDATQEAFIKAYTKWSKIRRYDSPAAWVRRVAINLSRDSFRSDLRRRRREESAQVDAPTTDTDLHADDASAVDLLRQLPRRQREIATLFYVDDRSVAEIATILRLREGTVKYHLAHARDGLRRLIDTGGVLP